LILVACGPSTATPDPDDGGAGGGMHQAGGNGGSSGGASGAGASGAGGTTLPPNACPPPDSCPAGGTVRGRVFAPNGTDPVDQALVARPIQVRPFPPEVACEVCSDLQDQACRSTISAPDGAFTLDRLPTGMQTIVLQKGRFRRQIQVDVPCGTLDLTPEQSRLPKSTAEGDIPKIAVATGDFDQIECVLGKIGLDPNAFDRYEGSVLGGLLSGLPHFDGLVMNYDRLKTYNIVFINCTNDTFENLLQNPMIQANLERYVRSGGRLYVTDWSYDWAEQVPQFSQFIDFDPGMSGSMPEAPNAAAVGMGDIEIDATVTDPALKEWLRGVGALGAGDTVHLKHFLEGWVQMLSYTDAVKEWISGPVPGRGNRPLTVTFDYNQCGRVLYSSYHTLGRDPASFLTPYPAYCLAAPLSPQERILEYLIFEISSCVQIG
jgi:hypothetical protein